MVSNKINWYRCDKIVASIYTWLLFLPNVWKSSIKKRLAIHYVNLKRIFSIWPLLASSFCCFCLCVRVCVSFVLEPHWNKYNIYINLDNFCNIELWVAGVWIYAYRAANKQKKNCWFKFVYEINHNNNFGINWLSEWVKVKD